LSNYTQVTFFAPKDALLSGNPAKLIKGADVDPELAAIAAAIASKYDATNFTFANPTATIGLSAVNGTSTNPMRSDAAPALSQAISPTWSGNHTFSNAITVNGAGSSLKGAVTLTAPASGPTLTVTGIQGTHSLFAGPNTGAGWNIQFNDTTNSVARGFIGIGTNTVVGAAVTDFGISPGVSGSVVIGNANGGAIATRFGPNGNVTIAAPSSGTALTVTGINNGRTADFTDGTETLSLQSDSSHNMLAGVVGAHSLELFTSNSIRLIVNSAGNVTINAPSSGQALTVNTASSGAAGILVNSPSTSFPSYLQLNEGGTAYGYVGADAGGNLVTGSSAGDMVVRAAVGAAAGTLRFVTSATGSSTQMSIGTAGNVTINAPSSGIALSATGAANSNTAVFTGSGITGQSFGPLVAAGTNSSDYSFQVRNVSGTQTALNIRGDGLTQAVDQGGSLQDVGWRGTPLNQQSGNYTLVLADRGKTINSAGASATITIPANVFSGGDVVSIRVASGNTNTIAQGTSLTLSWAGNGSSTGNRTLTGEGLATILFSSATAATISGAGLS
jgi:hypothetical protein